VAICSEVAAPLFVQCGLPLKILHILLECLDYEEDRRELNLQGALCDILGDNDGDVSIITAFLRGIGLDKYIFL
jgi:hypothetical protein